VGRDVASIRCRFLQPTGQARRSLQRFAWTTASTQCDQSGLSYHNAMAPLDVVAHDPKDPSGDLWDHADPRWPTTCPCGYVFQDTDAWQLFIERLHDDGQGGIWTLRDAPVGSMWWADWMADIPGSPEHAKRGGGPHLILKTPAGEWDIDSPSSNAGGQGWTRTGTPPVITARPSIGMGDPMTFHAFLTDGVLVEC
jgi:hypothetical protein